MELSLFYFIPLLVMLAVIAFLEFKNAVFVVLATVPLYLARVKIFGIPSTWLELAIYTLAGVWILKCIWQKDARQRCKEFMNIVVGNGRDRSLQRYFVLLFFISAIISALIAPDTRAGFGILKGWFFDPFLFFLLFKYAIRTIRDLLTAIFSLSLGTLALSLYGFWEFANKQFLTDAQRLDSVFESPNYFTMYAVPVLILSLGALAYVFIVSGLQIWRTTASKARSLLTVLIQYGSRRSSLFPCIASKSVSQSAVSRCIQYDISSKEIFAIGVSACAGLLALYLSASYGGWEAFLAGVFFLWVFLPRSKIKYAIFACGIAILAPIFLFTYERTGFIHRDPFWQEKTDSVSARAIIWRGAVHLLKEHPLAGIGLGGFRVRYKEYISALPTPPVERSVILPHNLYLNVWLETGLLGLIGFLGMVFLFAARSLKIFFRTKNYLFILPLAAMSAILAHGMVDTTYFKNDLSLLFWVILGMMVAVEKTTAAQRRE